MKKILLLNGCLLAYTFSWCQPIVVKNITEFNKANTLARPGDTIVLQNGAWNQVALKIDCQGTKEKPIVWKAQVAGKVLISGQSTLKIGGSYLVVDGLHFVNGFSGDDAVITFCTNERTVANNCRVTNTVIDNFNNPKRLDENYWISFYGKNNRLDHGSFLNKKNMGVLLAVLLDDERSRNNFHSIDHNYFGIRLPLASNTGEIIRVGVSQHCEFNSNTQITDNYFEHCDGEAEIISIKSCHNNIRNNLFKECQGAVVLRHGNYNTLENNVFLGNGKAGTGGVRIINKGQWVINNYFYQCRGEGFRAPLSIMNGVPNSPAFRYVAVTDAVIANNSFVDCSPLSFCLGADKERTEKPSHVEFLQNIFYNKTDTRIYYNLDSIDGIRFSENLVSKTILQNFQNGFSKVSLSAQKADIFPIPRGKTNSESHLIDSIKLMSRMLPSGAGFFSAKLFHQISANAYSNCGVTGGYKKNRVINKKMIRADCKNVADIIQVLANKNADSIIIHLTGTKYQFSEPLLINKNVLITGSQKKMIAFSIPERKADFFIQLKAGASLSLSNCQLDLAEMNTNSFISTDSSGSSEHSNCSITHCKISNLNGSVLSAPMTSLADNITISNCTFTHCSGLLLNFAAETDKKGYYNVEHLTIINNVFSQHKGPLMKMLRSGTDESTMGPLLLFSHNTLSKINSEEATIYLHGIQKTVMEQNQFNNCNPGKTLVEYEDIVNAVHIFKNNVLVESGKLVTDKFVRLEKNIIKGANY